MRYKDNIVVKRSVLLALVGVISASSALHSQVLPLGRDSLSFDLQETIITAVRKEAPVTGDMGHSLSFTPATIKDFPRMLGEVDPITLIQSLPGIHTNSTSDAGLYIHGFEDSHNVYTLAGAPTYLSPRMLGFFPVLNQSHFSRFRLKMDANGCYLGGSLESEISDSLYTKIHTDASVGLISARATFMAPLSDKVSISVSARKSFLNLVYRNVLKFGDNIVTYDFVDANATLIYKPDRNNTIDFNAYYSYDDVDVDCRDLRIDFGGNWHQGTGSLRWRHNGQVCAQTIAYGSFNFKNFFMLVPENDVKTPSDLLEAGIRSKLDFPLGFKAEIGAVYRGITPLSLNFEGNYRSGGLQYDTYQADIDITKKFNIGLVSITPGVLLSAYSLGPFDKVYFYPDPEIEIEINMLKAGKLTLSGKRKHQYFSQFGMSTSGMPCKFWVPAGRYMDPQESHGVSLSHTIDIKGGAWSVSTQAYWSKLYNQLEFKGFFFDFMSPDYTLGNSILKTDGFNYGANIMVAKNTGKVTGWVSYSYSRAMRTSKEPGLPDLFPATHDRPHELNAMLTYHVWHFDIGANMVWASGTPYTPAKFFYFLGDNIMAEYGDYNSGRLGNMFRLDLSLSYNLPTHGRYEHGVNLSVFNVTAHRNESVFFMKIGKDKYCYGPEAFVIPVLPSVSYYCKF